MTNPALERRTRRHASLPVRGATFALAAAAVAPPGLVSQEGPPEETRTRAEIVADSLEAPPPAVDPAFLGRDTVWASPGVEYPAGPIRRFLFGDLNRDLWTIEFPVPVLDLDAVGGGLEVDELSGGGQTLGLRLKARDGRTFQFRSMVKNAGRSIPSLVRSTPIEDVVHDQMGALFPLSAMVVAALLEEADILVATPRPVVMPDDPRLGDFREAFAGRMGWLEERPNEAEGDRPGFAGSSKITGTEEFLEKLREDPRSRVNDRALLRARLIDMLVNDWDRHQDQWRWASFPDDDRLRWDPIPRDRDWALARIDGVLPAVTRVYSPKYQGFSSSVPEPFRMGWSAQEIDRRLLTELERRDFDEVAAELVAALDDEAIDRVVAVLPQPYIDAVGTELAANLKRRRDALPEVATEFYELLAGWVDVFGTELEDHVVISSPSEGVLHVVIRTPGEDGFLTYERTFHEDETRDVRIYLMDGDDVVRVAGLRDLPIDVRIIGADGDDRYIDETDGDHVHVYDSEGDNEYELGSDAYLTESPFKGQEKPTKPYMIWDTRDWGHAWVPRPDVRYDSDIGLYAGFGVSRYGFGFGFDPYRSKYSVSLLSGFAPGQWIGDVEFERPFGDRGWRVGLNADWYTERPTWLFGFGNETEAPGSTEFFRSSRNQLELALTARWVPDSTFSARLGPAATLSGSIEEPETVFATTDPYGTDVFHQLGIRGLVTVDTRDSYSLPESGVRITGRAHAFPAWLDVEEPFAGGSADVRTYLSIDAPADPALHLRLYGASTFGLTPFGELPALGGAGSLPGYVERRFVGDHALSGSTLLRLRLARVNLFTETDLGVHGVGTVGRVWLDGESSDVWHSGIGGGLWLRFRAMDETVSLTYMNGGDGRGSFYLNLGFMF